MNGSSDQYAGRAGEAGPSTAAAAGAVGEAPSSEAGGLGDESLLPIAQRWPISGPEAVAAAAARLTSGSYATAASGANGASRHEAAADSSDRSLSPPPPVESSSPMAISGLLTARSAAAEVGKENVAPSATTDDVNAKQANVLQPKKRRAKPVVPGAAARARGKGKARGMVIPELTEEEKKANEEKIQAQLASKQSSKLILPAWISHMVSATGGGGTNVISIPASVDADGKEIEAEEGRRKRGTIFSVHVHPDGTRIATAGIDMKIKIWNTEPIFDPTWEARYEPEPVAPVDAKAKEKKKEEEENDKAQVNGQVEENGEAGPSAHPEAVVNGTANHANGPQTATEPAKDATPAPLDPMEERKKHKLLATLSRHTGSVLVVRWSHSGRYLASGSDDTIALLWEWDRSAPAASNFGAQGTTSSATINGAALEGPNIENWRPVRRLAGHTADVVDLAWSPADMYLATVSPDSMVIVYNGRTFDRIRRIEGHIGFIKGVCFDPVGQFMATAADDKTMKIWRTADWKEETTITKPFEGAPSSLFFARPSWSPDGAHILASNAMDDKVFISKVIERNSWSTEIALVGHENSVAVAAFSPRLFQAGPAGNANYASLMALGSLDQSVSVWLTGLSRPVLVARDVFERQVMDLSWASDGLTLYACSADGNVAAFVFSPDEVARPSSDYELKRSQSIWGFRPTPQQQAMLAEADSTGFGWSTNGTTASKPNVLQVRKGKGPANANRAVSPANGERLSQLITINDEGKRRIKPTHIDSQEDSSSVQIIDNQQLVGPTKRRASVSAEDLEALARQSKKLKDTGRNLGSDITRRASLGQKIIGSGEDSEDEDQGVRGRSGVGLRWLPVPPALRTYRRDQHGWALECRNSEEKTEPCEIALIKDSKITWIDWAPSVAINATCNDEFSAVSMADSTVIIYTKRGKRISTLRLAAPCIQLESTPEVLMLLTADGYLRRWSYTEGKPMHRPISLAGVIREASDVAELWLHRNGVPVLVSAAKEEVLILDPNTLEWTCVSSGFFADTSPLWDSRMRGRDIAASRESYAYASEPVRGLEVLINQIVVERPVEEGLTRHTSPKENAATFKLTCALRHLEARIQAAVLLDSPNEYKTHLLSYAKKISDEGVKNVAEDLIKSLIGPIYFIPQAESKWEPEVLGFNKRELLREVLSVLGRGKHLSGTVSIYQDILRSMLQ